MTPSKLSKYAAIILIFSLAFVLVGCRTKQGPTPYVQPKETVITYYKMDDGVDVMKPFFDEFRTTKGNELVKINYVVFNDLKKYEDRIINELAEGGGPDIFSMPNSWIAKHQKKIEPLPADMMTVKQFADTFVDVAEKDLVRPENPNDPKSALRIYGLPMAVDTLAVYYNKAHFEDKIPERGKPSTTWNALVQDIMKLTKADNSFERFEVAGAALGRADNIGRAIEILYSMMLQYETKFYDQNYKKFTVASQDGMTENNKPWVPGVEALNLYTSFAMPSKPHYTWNQYLSDPLSSEKEILAFAKGKASMIFGFSDYYKRILDAIQALKSKNQTTIEPAYMRVGLLPQLYDPAKTIKKRSTFALYYAETVSRTSKNAAKAWELIRLLTSKENLQAYNNKTHKPASRRDLIDEQKQNQIYGVFAEQAGFADSVLIYDYDYYRQSFVDAIRAVIDTQRVDIALKSAEEKVNSILPEKGLTPPGPYIMSGAATQAKTAPGGTAQPKQ